MHYLRATLRCVKNRILKKMRSMGFRVGCKRDQAMAQS